MESRAPISAASLLATGVAIACGIGLVAWLAPVLYRWRANELRDERGWTSIPQDTRQTKLAQQAQLARYAWLDRTKGVVSLPIERAMSLCASEMSGAHGTAPANAPGGTAPGGTAPQQGAPGQDAPIPPKEPGHGEEARR